MENSIKNLKRAFKYAKDMGFNESDFYTINVWEHEVSLQGVQNDRANTHYFEKQSDGFRRHYGNVDKLAIRIIIG